MSRKSPWLFVPSLYFQQGLPVILIQQFSVLLYKKLGVENGDIGLWTSLIAWPWIIKMLWGPLVDAKGTKRAWIFGMQAAITVLLACSGFFVTHEHFLPITLLLFFAAAFFSATHDIALDGYYLLALRPENQAFFIGIRSTFFRLAMIFCTGTLVLIAGRFETEGWTIAKSWQISVWIAAGLYGVLAVYGYLVAPRAPSDQPKVDSSSRDGASRVYRDAFRTFFTQKGVVRILLFILLYRFGESMLSKISGLFLLDPRDVGGLGFETTQVGLAIGNVGVIALVSGGLLGGFAISRFGLKPLLWPMALSMYIPNLLYVWAAQTQPGLGSMAWIIGVDQFGYGFGLASFLVYLLSICRNSRFQTSHYAIATGLMALGAMGAGILSGFLQQSVGYFWFFVAVCGLSFPGLILLQLIPLDEEALTRESAKAAIQEG